MDVDVMQRSPVGRLVPITGTDARHGSFAYFSYLPDALPDDLVLSSRSWTAVAEASAALGRLDQVCRHLPDPRLLLRPALWREALDTSALEGTVGVLRDLLEARLPSAHLFSPETAEVRAYERVALHAFDAIARRGITLGLLGELQEQLFAGLASAPAEIGGLRRSCVWIGPADRPIADSRFVPPPADDRLRAGMDEWQRWVGSGRGDLPPLVRAAMAHYQFETLHPFADGNGRIGRLVIVLQLMRDGTLAHPALTVSPWLLRHRGEYQDSLLHVSRTGEWDPWITLLSRAVIDQCESVVAGGQQILAWLTAARTSVNQRRWSGAIHDLVNDLIEWPVVTIGDVAARYRVSVPNATRMINHLAEVGILEELTGRSYRRVFGATGVIDVVERI